MQEIYKDIVGYEGLYQVSNLGNVKSFHKKNKGLLLSPGFDTGGYLLVILQKSGKKSTQKVHRLVALAFIPNPDNKPQVNHKNGIKTNNTIENLEWNTSSENVKHSFDTGLKFAKKGEFNNKAKLTTKQV